MDYQKKKIFRYIFISSFIFFIVIGFILFYPYHYVLSFEDPYEKELIAYLPVKEGDKFQIKYTHSVHLSDVYEEFKIEKNVLYPVELIYEDTAVGMPAHAEEGETFEMRDGKYYISNLQGSHQSITLAVGQVRADHTVIHQGESYELKEYVGAGSIVTISANHTTKWKLLKGAKMNE